MNSTRNPIAASCGGLLGWFASLLGPRTPAYVGDGQPSSTCAGGWSLFGGTPTYQVAAPEPAPTDGGDEVSSTAPDAGNGAGTDEAPVPIAIIIRRDVRPEDVAG
jgi:hypothetical protein